MFSRRHTTLNIYWNTKGKGGKGDDQDGGDDGGRSAGAAAAAKAQALISDKLTKAQQRMDPAGEQGTPRAPAHTPARSFTLAVDICPICALHAKAHPALPLLPFLQMLRTGMPALAHGCGGSTAFPQASLALPIPIPPPLHPFAELIRQLGLNVDLSLLRSVRAAPSLQQRLLGSKWRAAALAGYQVDLAGKSVLTIADWKRRGGDY